MTFAFVGVDFFILTPIGVRYPRYRLLVSPWTWLLWKIPTHGIFFAPILSDHQLICASLADWAIARLQAEAEKYLAQRGELGAIDSYDEGYGPKPSKKRIRDKPEEPQMIGRYPCRDGDVKGDLVLTTTAISFSPKHSSDQADWVLPFHDLIGIQKVRQMVERRHIID